MDFSLTDEQQLLRDTADAVVTRECPTTLLRATIDDASAADALWGHLRDFSALATADTVDIALFLDRLGYAAAPGPFLPTVALFGPLATAIGSGHADAVVAGERTGTVAVADERGRWWPHGSRTKHGVVEAAQVDTLAVIESGPVVKLVDSEGVVVREVETIDPTRRVYEIDATDAEPHVLDPDAWQGWLDRAVVLMAAELVGTSRRCFDMALAYAKEREQFGRPIGSFQALQHKLAEASLELERATAAVQYAAMAVDAGDPDRTRAAHVAKAAAGEAARRNVKDSIQVHGGIGYTWDHDLHLFLRRATAGEYLLGSTDWHHDQLAEIVC